MTSSSSFVPTKKLKYNVGDGGGDKLVEWYCSPCFKRWVEKEPNIAI
ncbi:MAG TPA: hypothetical protein VE548_11840 [Nitrososphaeraceae archaeon]|jgi:hypothetical protein|nr:hypothetical protein [Nitrososphaeraceae archaeon]